MKPGDRVRFSGRVPEVMPPHCVPAGWLVADGDVWTVLSEVNEHGALLVVLDGESAEQLTGDDHLPEVISWRVPAACLDVVPPALPEGWRVERDGTYLCVYSPYRMLASVALEGSVLAGDLYVKDGAGLIAALAHALVEVTSVGSRAVDRDALAIVALHTLGARVGLAVSP